MPRTTNLPMSIQACQSELAERLRLGLPVRVEWRAAGSHGELRSCSLSLPQLERTVHLASGNDCYSACDGSTRDQERDGLHEKAMDYKRRQLSYWQEGEIRELEVALHAMRALLQD